MVAAHIERGRSGEALAVRWYEQHGYAVLDRNWRATFGEIDLVVRRGDTLVICEVKARRNDAYGVPALAVGVIKQRRLRRLGAAWLAAHRIKGRVVVRFDVVAVTGERIDVYEGAF